MKILVFSDSHSSLSFMRRCVKTVKPDMILHLGDYYDDGETIHEEFPGIDFCQVPGNCDRYRCPPGAREMLVINARGPRLYLTHGHCHFVKQSIGLLLSDARKENVQAVLYGHTHIPDCHREPDGLWVLNPGSCGGSGSAGIIEVEDRKICACYLIRQADLEVMK